MSSSARPNGAHLADIGGVSSARAIRPDIIRDFLVETGLGNRPASGFIVLTVPVDDDGIARLVDYRGRRFVIDIGEIREQTDEFVTYAWIEAMPESRDGGALENP